jgi:hypothetical protein
MSSGLVGKLSNGRAVEPRRFEFIRWTVVLLPAVASIPLAEPDTGVDPRTDLDAGHNCSGVTGLQPKTLGRLAPEAEAPVRFGAACAPLFWLPLILASLASPDASPIFPLTHVCDSLREAFAASGENVVSAVSAQPRSRLEWSVPSQNFLFTLEGGLDSPASGLSTSIGNNADSVAQVEDQPSELAQETPTADDSTCSSGLPALPILSR